MSISSIVTGAIDTVREMWPDGDPAKLKRAAAAYDQFADAVRQSGEVGSRAAVTVQAAADGDAVARLRDYYAPLDRGLPQLADRATDQAHRLREYADAITDGRNQIKSLIIEIGAVMAIGAAVSLASLGFAAPAAEATAVLRTSALVARAARIGITLNATVARLAVSAARGIVVGTKLSLIEIPVIKATKVAAGIDEAGLGLDDLREGALWMATGAGVGGLTSAARSGMAVRRLSRVGAAQGWGKPALTAVERPARVVRTVGRSEPLELVTAEMDRLTYQTGREHGLVDKNGVRSIIAGEDGAIAAHGGELMRIHTHPYGWPYKGPSLQDYHSLHSAHLRSGLESATVLQDGVEYTYSIYDDIYRRLFPEGGG